MLSLTVGDPLLRLLLPPPQPLDPAPSSHTLHPNQSIKLYIYIILYGSMRWMGSSTISHCLPAESKQGSSGAATLLSKQGIRSTTLLSKQGELHQDHLAEQRGDAEQIAGGSVPPAEQIETRSGPPAEQAAGVGALCQADQVARHQLRGVGGSGAGGRCGPPAAPQGQAARGRPTAPIKPPGKLSSNG